MSDTICKECGNDISIVSHKSHCSDYADPKVEQHIESMYERVLRGKDTEIKRLTEEVERLKGLVSDKNILIKNMESVIVPFEIVSEDSAIKYNQKLTCMEFLQKVFDDGKFAAGLELQTEVEHLKEENRVLRLMGIQRDKYAEEQYNRAESAQKETAREIVEMISQALELKAGQRAIIIDEIKSRYGVE